MKQIARNLTDSVDGFLKHTKYLILDRDLLHAGVSRNAQWVWGECRPVACTSERKVRVFVTRDPAR